MKFYGCNGAVYLGMTFWTIIRIMIFVKIIVFVLVLESCDDFPRDPGENFEFQEPSVYKKFKLIVVSF
jgi:hypothetical protein